MMFDHLDDPAGFEPGAAFRATVTRRSRHLLRRRRAVRSAIVAIPISALGVAAAVPIFEARKVHRVNVAGVLGPATHDDAPLRILVVGTDGAIARSVKTAQAPRNDTVLVVEITERAVTITSVPRDLYVTPPGRDALRRINEMSPVELLSTVAALIGAPIQHYVSTDMDGFVAIADAVGGIRVRFDAPIRDATSGFAASPGCQSLEGGRLLSYLRSRHIEGDPTGDLGRRARQRAALIQGLARLRDASAIDLARATDAVAPHLTLDAGFGVGDLAELARRLRATETTAVADVPAVAATLADGTAVLLPAGAPGPRGSVTIPTPSTPPPIAVFADC